MENVKEKLHSVSAKLDEKVDKTKAVATGKMEEVMAHDKAGKDQALAKEHQKEKEATEVKEQKLAGDIAERHHIKN